MDRRTGKGRTRFRLNTVQWIAPRHAFPDQEGWVDPRRSV
jgi:hypothetical protein